MKKIIISAFVNLLVSLCFAQKVPLENPDTFYEIVDDTLLVISGQGNLENWLDKKDLWDEYKSNITAIVVEDGIRDIAKNYFYGLPELKSVTMANSVKRILQSAFYSCQKLETVNWSDSLEVIKAEAFSICPKITSLWLPNTVTEIGDAAFAICKLTSLRLPDFITEISENAFRGGNLSSIEIPSLVTAIKEEAFFENRLLKKVKLPASLTLIDDDAFGHAYDIDTVIALNPIPPITYLDFFVREERVGIPKLIVPVTSVTAYENASYWDVFTIVGGGYVAFAYTDTDDNKTGGHVIQPEQRHYQPGEEVTFKAQPKEGYRFVNWTTYSAGGSKAEVVVSTDSVYTCTVGEDNIELTANFEKVTVGVEETEFSAAQFGFTLSPNPASTTVNVNFTGSGTSTVSLSLYNISGVLVKTWDNIATPNASLDVSGVNSGNYILIAEQDSGYAYKRLIIQ